MIFHKSIISLMLCATFGIAISASIGDFETTDLRRSRRSDDGSKEASRGYSSEDLTGYRFGDEFFSDGSAEAAEATQHTGERTKKVDGCERVVKNAMICMVCKDPKTNSNYEQCSYVARPKDKAQSYSSSRSFQTRPQEREETSSDEEKPEATSYGRYEDERPESYDKKSAEEDEDREESYASDKPESSEDDTYEVRESSPSFRSNGRHREETRPKVTNQRKNEESDESGEYGDRIGQSSYESSNRRAPSAPRNNERKKSNEGHSGHSTNNPKEKKRGKCREVQRDSMTCTICKNPENGGNFEKCSYNHQPNDRHYKFSKSKRFGYPHEESATEETKRISEVVDPTGKPKKSQCRKIQKNSTTVCNVCKNSSTGERSEHCESGIKSAPSNVRISRTLPRSRL